MERNADTKTMRAVLASLEAKNPAEAHTVASWSLFLALRERDASAATRALALLPPGETQGQELCLSHAVFTKA